MNSHVVEETDGVRGWGPGTKVDLHGTHTLCLSKERARAGGQEVSLSLQFWSGRGRLHC